MQAIFGLGRDLYPQPLTPMCQYKSAILQRDESVKDGFRLHLSMWTESHSDLARIFHLPDVDKRLDAAKVEFSPPDMSTAHLVDTYVFKLDQERTPDWFTDEIKEKAIERLKVYINSIIVDGDVYLLIGGQFILAPKAKVACAQACIITAMLGSASVGTMLGSASVGEMLDSANVASMLDSANVGSDNREKKIHP